MLASLAPVARLLLLVVFEVGALVVLHRLGAQPWLQVEPDLATWLSAARPEDAVVVVLRYAGLATGWWLAATTALYLLASVTRVPAAVRAVGWATLPAVRRVADRAVAVGLASSLVTAAPAVAATAPAPVVIEAPAGIAVPEVLPPALAGAPAGAPPGGDAGTSPRLSLPAVGPPGAPHPHDDPASPLGPGDSGHARDVAGDDGRSRDEHPARPLAEAPSSGGAGPVSAISDEADGADGHPNMRATDPAAAPGGPAPGGTPVSEAAGALGSPEPTATAPHAAGPAADRSSTEASRSTADATGPAARATPVAGPGAEGPLGATAATAHVVAPGEHLWGVAEAHLAAVGGHAVSEAEIAAYWQRVVAASTPALRSGDPDLVHPGERVVLPPVDPPEA